MVRMTESEKGLMLLITGLTNCSCFPALYILYHKGLIYQFHVGLFTFFTSFMYHSLESVEWYSLYLDQGTWHKLDNIGSIQCFIGLFIYWMDNYEYKKGNYHSMHNATKDIHLNMLGMFITMIMQAKHPWNLENTIIPIAIFVKLFILKSVFYQRPRFNSYYFSRGLGLMLIAVVFFIKGLDEKSDYLRIHHGLWHCFIGLSSFYLWQSIDKDKTPDSSVTKCESQKRFSFLTVLKKLLFFKFFESESIYDRKTS